MMADGYNLKCARNVCKNLLTMRHNLVESNPTNATEQCLPFYYLPFAYIQLQNGYKNGHKILINSPSSHSAATFEFNESEYQLYTNL